MLMVRKIVLLLIASVTCSLMAVAQSKQVSGTVKDANGNAIVGATVMVEGTSNGVNTGSDGSFRISAPADGYLLVSFLGYEEARVAIAGKTSIDVVLADDTQSIDDVIVVAFGTAKKEAFTGSASVVKADELEKRQTTNVLNALVGQVPGLQMRGSTGQPGSSAGSINIRGINSMYAGTSPLVIVDGAPYSASLSNIPQSDIESVTVLKDAASAALYGARGASGVIIVTTKKGRSHDAVINIDMKWGVNSRAMQDYDLITDPGEYYEAYYAQIYNKYYYGQGYSAASAAASANADMLSDLQYNVFSYPAGESLIVDGKLNPNATLGRRVNYNGQDYWLTPDDWTDEAYRNSLRQEYNISMNGGTDRASYYMSLGYLNEDGIVYNSNYERITARLRADYQAKKWLKVGGNVAFVNSDQDQNSNWGTSQSAGNLFAYTSRIAPIYPVYMRTVDADGNISIMTDEYGNKAYDYGVASRGYGVTRPYLSTGNPLGENQYNRYTSGGNQLNGSFFADVDFTSWLKFNATSTVTWGQTNVSDFGNMYYGTPAQTGGDIGKSSTSTLRTNHLQTLTYYDTFGNHNINVMLGHEYYDTQTKYLYAHGRGMFSPEIPEISASATKDDSDSYSSEYNVEGYFLSAQYDYAGKYYASASFRRDASSYFAKDHRWGSFWSLGAAWIISKENFMSNALWVDMLKLKASIGQQGNDSVGSFAYVDMYSLSSSSETSMTPTFWRKGNPELTWETTTNFNAGVEFSLWRGRLTGSIDVYNKKTTDLLFWVSIPESSGTRGMYDNVGDMRNTGVEISLQGALIRTKNVDWTISMNLSHNSNKILSLPDSKIDPATGGFNEDSYFYRVGGPMYNYYSAVYAGVDQYGQAMFYVDQTDENGNVIGRTTTYDFNNATKYEHGSILPKVFGGFGTTVRIANFDVSATFDYQLGGKVFDGYYQSVITPAEDSGSAGQNIHKDWVRSWSVNNTSSDMPRWQYGDAYGGASSDRFLTNASYLNFQSFTVGYTLPMKTFNNKLKMRIYVAGENLCYWSARKGLDPRYSYSGNSSVIPYSPIRTISGGIQLTF